jgi:RNA polymerase sigma-70 factor (ECF subfamily)
MLEMRRRDAISDLYRELGPRLWRAVFAFSQDESITSDAVAEAFAQCLQRGDAVRDPAAWIYRTAFRLAAGELKERRRFTALPETSYDMPSEPGALLAALGKLPRNQRAALVLHHYVGYGAKDIGQILGITAGTTRVHLSRARRRLRSLLEDDHD